MGKRIRNIYTYTKILLRNFASGKIKENFRVFDFTLDDDDMQTLRKLDTHQGLFLNHGDPEKVNRFNTLKFS